MTTAPLTTADRDRALAATVALTTHCAMGGAIRWRQERYLRRDWMLFVPLAPADDVPAEAAEVARDLDCDLIGVEFTPGHPVTLRAGMRLWDKLFWRGGMRLWRDDTGGRCCLVDLRHGDEHLWLETGRVVAHGGLPWRGGADRDLGFARAEAAFRRLTREA